MKKILMLAVAGGWLTLNLTAAETLWNLDFKDAAIGSALVETPYATGCAGPQKVTVSDACPLTVVKAVGDLSPALLFTKEGTEKYTPLLLLRGKTPFASGIFTVKFDLVFDRVTPVADKPLETLIIGEFINGDGGFTHGLGILRKGGETLELFTIGGDKGSAAFKLNEVVHVRAVLDTNQHTLQIFLNDQPLTGPAKDDAKFSSFWGFKLRDGSALGGNYGTGFTAGLANLVITQE